MQIQPKIIDHLGINMYTSLHAVISELIANSWDADANSVWITIPEGKIGDDYEITVKDDGKGMSLEELNILYLQVGRNKREEEGDRPTPSGRTALGRKGIGKFSVFGVAHQVIIRSVKNHEVTQFEMEIEKIKSASGIYEPHILETGNTGDENGVTVKLVNLKRKNAVDLKHLRQGLANRFLLFGHNFNVYLNSVLLTEDDIKVEDIEYTWPIDEVVSEEYPGWRVKGTIWSKKGTIREMNNRGVALFARKKLVQEPTFFGATSGKEYAYDHLFGKLEADFLDGEHDVVSTNRASINLESEEGQAMSIWGKKKLTEISIDWSSKRVAQRTETVTRSPDFSNWFSELTPTERKKATKVFDSITRNDSLSEEKVRELAGYVRDTFQFSAFQDLSQEIEEATPEQVPKIIELFRNWEHLEAKEMYRVFQGRTATMKKLENFIKTDAKEVPTIHEYIKKFPWILNPRWTIIENEARFSKLLKQKFAETNRPARDRRLDFLCFSTWPALIVVELKRPGHAVGKDDLEQLREYCLFMEENKGGTDSQYSLHKIFGYMICENEQKSKAYDIRREKLAEAGMFVLKYSELLSVARRINEDFLKKLEEIKEATRPSINNPEGF